MLFIITLFNKTQEQIQIKNCVIEENGSSDEKVSSHPFKQGRGAHVTAECYLKESILKKVLRTSSDKLMECFIPSQKLKKIDEMFVYNINTTKAIAAIFANTAYKILLVLAYL